jgi:glycerophosphoryl diester phosphodiesterase
MRLAGLLSAGLACLSATATAAPANPVTVVAHRGLAEGMPENTLAAFRRSVEGGLGIIELDVRTTKDGHLVILHDETLDRTTDCSGLLSDHTLSRIKSCDAGWPSHAGERIPTLAEVLDFARDRPVQLLLDVKSGASVQHILREIRDRHAESKVVLGLRRTIDISLVRKEAPAVAVLAFMPNFSDASIFASSGAAIVRLWSDWVEADPGIVAKTQSLGTKVWIMVGRKLPKGDGSWRALHARMVATGADGLITNRPELISAP